MHRPVVSWSVSLASLLHDAWHVTTSYFHRKRMRNSVGCSDHPHRLFRHQTVTPIPQMMPLPSDLPQTWKQGQHVGVVGRTGSGKTYLVSKLVMLRRYVIIFRTKPDTNKFP